jgi:hypothetical protein
VFLLALPFVAENASQNALAIVFDPIATSGHDADIVFEAGLSVGQPGANNEIGGRQFYEQGVSTQTAAHKPGLPQTAVGVATSSGNTINFRFEPFELNNVLKFTSGATPKSLLLKTPAAYSHLAVVFSAGDLNSNPTNGPLETATINYTINYNGGLSQTGSFRSADWSVLSTPASNGTERFLSVGRIGNASRPVWPQTPETDVQPNRWNLFHSEISLTNSMASVLSVTFGPVTLDDSDRLLNADDDVVIFGLAGLSSAALSLEVNSTSGQIRFINSTSATLDLTGYEITSAAGSLNMAGWNSLSDQNLDPVDGPDAGGVAGNGPGETWDEAVGASNFALQEGFLLGGSSVPPGGSLSIGAAYNTTLDARDLAVTIRRGDSSIVPLAVEYLEASIPGDFDGDLDVDANDLQVWKSNFSSTTAGPSSGDADGDADVDGHDFLVWQRNLGVMPTGAAVPEPDAAILAVVLTAALTVASVRRVSRPGLSSAARYISSGRRQASCQRLP